MARRGGLRKAQWGGLGAAADRANPIFDDEAEHEQYLLDSSQRGIAFASLNVFDRGQADARHLGQVELRYSQRVAPQLHNFVELHSLI